MVQLKGTTVGQRLSRALHTLIVLSTVVFSPPSDLHVGFKNSIGNVDIRMEYHCLVAPITLST